MNSPPSRTYGLLSAVVAFLWLSGIVVLLWRSVSRGIGPETWVLAGMSTVGVLRWAWELYKQSIRPAEISAPELFIDVDYSNAKRDPGTGRGYKVVIVENNGGRDAFNVQVQKLCLDASGRISAIFKPIPRIGAHSRSEVEAVVQGLKGGNVSEFETIYYFGEVENHWRDQTEGHGWIEYDLHVDYEDYARNRYRASAHVRAESHGAPAEIRWLGAKRLAVDPST